MSTDNPTEYEICATITRSGLFDADWYLKQNLDVAQSDMDPIIHYVRHGEKEHRRPNPDFDPAKYEGKNKSGNLLYAHIMESGIVK